MRMYTATYLPIGKIKEVGDKVISSRGDIHTIGNEMDYTLTNDDWKCTHLFLVYSHFNQQVIVGAVSNKATWLNAGDKIKSCDTKEVDGWLQIKCNCGNFH